MPDVPDVPKRVATRHPLRNIRAFRSALLRWFDESGTDYPWRRTTDPYAILVSEVMLQQTTIGAVIRNRRFERFLEKFPDLRSLAEAPESALLRTWEGLGYYNRVRNLQETARVILKDHDGEFPADPPGLESLPGIGRYTAGAVASFAFDYPAPIVEANISRVLSRLFDYREPVDAPEGAQAVPTAPEASTTSASTVGLPRESSPSKALISTISAMSHLLSQFPAACGAGAACLFIVLTNIQGRQRFNQIVYGLHLREERLQG